MEWHKGFFHAAQVNRKPHDFVGGFQAGEPLNPLEEEGPETRVVSLELNGLASLDLVWISWRHWNWNKITGRWFQIFFIFAPKIGEDSQFD